MGAGCAFLDYDGDGWQDILLVNGMDWPGHKQERSTLRLYRNNRNGTFSDVTRAAGGLAVRGGGAGDPVVLAAAVAGLPVRDSVVRLVRGQATVADST